MWSSKLCGRITGICRLQAPLKLPFAPSLGQAESSGIPCDVGSAPALPACPPLPTAAPPSPPVALPWPGLEVVLPQAAHASAIVISVAPALLRIIAASTARFLAEDCGGARTIPDSRPNQRSTCA